MGEEGRLWVKALESVGAEYSALRIMVEFMVELSSTVE